MRRVRTLSLVLLLALTLLAPAAAERGAQRVGDCTAQSSWGTPLPGLAARVVDLINAHRRALGLRALNISPTLARAAVWKARHMARFRYMSHDDPAPPVGRTAAERIAACGYAGAGWGENIAYGYATPVPVVQAWLNSPGHRANIENRSFSVTGVGAASANGMVFWAQDFGTMPDTGTTAPSRSPSTARAAARPAELGLGRLLKQHAQPHAGHRFSDRAVVMSLKTRRAVTSGDVKCDARVGRRYLRVVLNAFRNELAACAWRVPRWAKGRHLTGRIRVRAEGSWGVRWFWRHIR